MISKRRKLEYAVMALLFLAIVGIIGWLALILFGLRIDPNAAPLPDDAPAARLHRPTPGPSSETVVYAGDVGPSDPGVIPDLQPVSDPLPGKGNIPCVCEGGGPPILGRDSFRNPLMHQSVFTPTHARITLTIPEPVETPGIPNP